jgi:hypothetical protein
LQPEKQRGQMRLLRNISAIFVCVACDGYALVIRDNAADTWSDAPWGFAQVLDRSCLCDNA